MFFWYSTSSRYVISRGVALFLSVFMLLSIIGGICFPGFNGIRWILHISFLPEIFTLIFIGFLGVYLLTFTFRPRMREYRKTSLLIFLSIYAFLLVVNTFEYYYLLFKGMIKTKLPVPFTLILLFTIVVMILRIRRIKVVKDAVIRNSFLATLRRLLFFIDFMPFHLHINVFASRRTDKKMKNVANSIVSETFSPKKRGLKVITALQILLVFGISAFAFTLGQIYCYGLTSYERKVDAVVVLGASVHADGTMSLVLEDRIRTACALVKSGKAEYLICSGGPGPGRITEARAMRSFALRQGIAYSRILVDDHGLNTFETVSNLQQFIKAKKLKTFMAVSHFYHLPRIKLTCESFGITVFTVPAEESRTPSALPYFILREVFALWFYFFKTMIHKTF